MSARKVAASMGRLPDFSWKRPMHHPPAHQRGADVALQAAAVEGGVLGLGEELGGVGDTRRFGVEEDEVGRRAALKPPSGEAEQVGGGAGDGAEQGHKVDTLVVVERE